MDEHHGKSAEKLMSARVPVAFLHDTIRHIESMLLENEAAYASIDYIYIVDRRRHLKGVLSIKDLFRLPRGMVIDDVMSKEIVSVHPHAHQEHVARLALRYRLKAIPVIEPSGRFLGAVPAHTVLSIVHEELTEDVYRFAGIESHEYASLSVLRSTPVRMVQVRLPWLIIGLAGGVATAKVVGVFEGMLQAELALVGFLPLIVYISDAVGGQSQTIFVRSLAMESRLPFGRYFVREFAAATVIGAILALLLLAFTTLTGTSVRVGTVIAISLFLTVLISIATALAIPATLAAGGKDPAIASGPFATMLRDISSILVYFAIANMLL